MSVNTIGERFYDDVAVQDYVERVARYAAKHITHAEARKMRLAGAVRDLGPNGAPLLADASKVLAQGRDGIARRLVEQSALGNLFRAIAPLDVVVPRLKREAIMRSVAASLGSPTLGELWDSGALPDRWLDGFVDRTIAAIEPTRGLFSRFVWSQVSTNWIVAADFCLDAKEKYNDVYAYTVYGVLDVDTTVASLRQSIPLDIKHVRRPSEAALRRLGAESHYTFAFVTPRRQRVIQSLQHARQAIDETLNRLMSVENPSYDSIAAAKKLKQEAQANSFSYRLLEKMMLNAAFAALIGVLLSSEGRAQLITFIPDRDNMTSKSDAVLFDMFNQNIWAYSMRYRVPPPIVAYGYDDSAPPGADTWYDPLIRVPDHIAGALASVELVPGWNTAKLERHRSVLKHVLADNPNVAVVSYSNLSPASIDPVLHTFTRSPLHRKNG